MSVKKRYRLFTILSVLVVSAGGILTWRASATTTIQRGYDQFNTIGAGGTQEHWGDCNAIPQRPALPANFFTNAEGFGSNPLTPCDMEVDFAGRNAVPGFTGDTVLERTEDAIIPGHPSSALLLTGLRFVKEGQITVTFTGGTSPITYTVLVDESQKHSSTGNITFNDDPNHTYNSLIGINRVYTFVPTIGGQPTKIAESFDTVDGNGVLVFPALNLNGSGTWSLAGGASAAPAIQPQSGMAVAAAAASPSPPCLINPNSEAGTLASHGILPAGCATPTPSPSPTVTVKPTVAP